MLYFVSIFVQWAVHACTCHYYIRTHKICNISCLMSLRSSLFLHREEQRERSRSVLLYAHQRKSNSSEKPFFFVNPIFYQTLLDAERACYPHGMRRVKRLRHHRQLGRPFSVREMTQDTIYYGLSPAVRHRGISAHGHTKPQMEPPGERCIMMRVAHKYPRGTFRVQHLATYAVVCRKNISWHPNTAKDDEETGVERSSRGGDDFRVSAGKMFGALRVEMSRTLQLENSQPSGGEKQQQQPEQQESRAIHQLNDHITGQAPQLRSKRTRSGSARPTTGNSAGAGVALCSMLRDGGVKRNTALVGSLRSGDYMAVQETSTMP